MDKDQDFHRDWIAALNLQNRHEAAYFDHLTRQSRAPQIEIDVLLLDLLADHCHSMIDLGANIGFVAMAALQRGFDRILCYEPEPSLFARLQNLTGDHLTALPFAVGSRTGMVDFHISQSHNQGHTVCADTVARFRPIFGAQLTQISVPMVTLDGTITAPFDYWKIDVEGNELDLLNGARATLMRYPPRAIAVEIYDQDRLCAVADLLMPLGYQGFQIFVMQAAPRLRALPVSPDHAQIQTLNGAAIHAPTFLFAKQPIAARLDMA